jgi:hypothetical protein
MSERDTRAVLEILGRLIEMLAARGIIDQFEVLELAEIAKGHGRG